MRAVAKLTLGTVCMMAGSWLLRLLSRRGAGRAFYDWQKTQSCRRDASCIVRQARASVVIETAARLRRWWWWWTEEWVS